MMFPRFPVLRFPVPRFQRPRACLCIQCNVCVLWTEGQTDRQTDRRTRMLCAICVGRYSQTSSSQYVPRIYTHASQRAAPNHQHSCRSPCALLLLSTASALISKIFIHSSHTHPHATPLPELHFHQIVSQTADITWQSKAVFDFLPNLDSVS